VYEQLPKAIQIALGKRQDFCRQVSVTRNYLTHYDRRLRENALTGRVLWLATIKLRLVLRIVLLQELGVEPLEKLREQRLIEQYAKG
jgi:hypothetical protein